MLDALTTWFFLPLPNHSKQGSKIKISAYSEYELVSESLMPAELVALAALATHHSIFSKTAALVEIILS